MFNVQKKWVAVLSIVALLLSLFPTSAAYAEAEVAAEDETCGYITVDGLKEDLWNSVPTLGTSASKGWNDFHIDNLKLTNDCTYLYYWIDGVKLDNWGENGLYLNLVLSINGGPAADVDVNAPWGTGFNFSAAEELPSYQVVSRIKNNNELNGAAIYKTDNLNEPIASSWGDSKDAQFANAIDTGFEGRIPLSLLGLAEGDSIKAIAVLSGNNDIEHGAFDVIPESANNNIAQSWNVSAEPNTQAEYTTLYSISFQAPELVLASSVPAAGEHNVSTELSEIRLNFIGELIWDDASQLPVLQSADTSVAVEAGIDEGAVIIKLLEKLSYHTTYTMTLPAGSIKNLAEDKTITFTTEKDPSTMNTYNIHYYRLDGQQSQWDIWTWDDVNDGREIDFTGTDESGFATVSITSDARIINVITRPGDWSTQEETRIITMPQGQQSVDVWLIQGDETVYYNAEDVDLSAKVQAAFMDSLTSINVTTTEELQPEQLNGFYVMEQAEQVSVAVKPEKLGKLLYRLTVDEDAIDVTKLYRVGHSSLNSTELVFRNVLNDQKFYYGGSDLGLTYHTTGSTFKLWAPTASAVSVAIYDEAGQYNAAGKVEDHTGGTETMLSRSEQGVWSGTVNGDLAGQYYMYHVQFADGSSHYVVDPYARAVAANGARTAIVSLEATDPTGWSNDQKPAFMQPTDAIIYELHIRDFSISEDSGVSEASRGKYAAFTESGLVDEFGHSLGIDHLVELGITHLHLLPAYDYQTVNELTVNDPASTNPKFNWGYDPQNYNVPEGSYSSDPANPTARITEFKQMVQALHERGIRVVMDVVYNHTYSIEDGPFNKIVPGYFYRTNSNGSYSNGSGVGNEIATERPMVRKYIKDSVNYWAQEYHIDGFRFDLMGIIDTTTMAEITQELHQEVDPSILIYGEPWMGGSTPLPGTDQTLKGSQKDLNFAVFNDHFRSAIKGDSDGAGKGFATGDLEAGNIDGILKGLIGATTDFTNAPTETINYVTAHDNLNLWDKVLRTQNLFEELNMLSITNGELNNGGNVDDAVAAANPYRYVDQEDVFANETVKRSLLANGIVLTAQGIPFIHAGDELLRSKYGDHNSYRSPDSVNKINWGNKASFADINEYYKGLIKLRTSHPAFRMTTKAEVDAHLNVLESADGVVAYTLGEYANGDEWKNIVVIYNGASEARNIKLPAAGEWNVVVNATAAGTSVLSKATDSVTVDPISMMVLYDEATEDTSIPTTLEVKLAKKAMEAGKDMIATAVVKDQRGRIMTGEEITWSSSNEGVATITDSGRIRTLKEGTTTITASAGELTASAQLIVASLVPTELVIQGEDMVYADFTSKLTATVRDQFGQVMSSQPLKWTSSDQQVATVDSTGIVTGVSPGHAVITAAIGDIKASFTVEVKSYVKRYIQFEYEREDKDYTDWDLWVWNTGVINDAIPFTIEAGKAIALVEVAPNVTQVGFIVRKGNWLEKDTEADRFVNIRLDESYVVVKITSGQAEFLQTPYIAGPIIEGNDVTFYYRHEELYRSNEHHRISEVKVKLGDREYSMAYDTAGEYYSYTWQDMEEGEYPYTFLVTIDGETIEIVDPKNNVDGVSKIIYQPIKIDLSASIAPDSFDYNTHSLLTIETETPKELISSIYADLTALGGHEQVPIDKELMALTISVTDDVTAGVKSIPVTIIDRNQVEHQTSAEVTVNARQVSGKHDFDWDEARIYFMLTDRFYDGDESNNDPNGESYDTDHAQTYHGGDFQGIIDKLDYLEKLGINTIWITPIVDNVDWNVGHGQPWQYQYGYHGYWAKDFTKLDEHLGDLDTFKELIDKAHDRGIKLMVDVVLNHTGYGMDAEDERLNVPNYPTEEEQAVFSGMIRNPAGAGDLHGELAGLPDLRTEDAAVREQIIAWQVDWLERARTERGDTIDYFRVDTVKHVEPTTWTQFKNELTKIEPQFKLIGEVFGAYVDDQRGYLGAGMMDSLLDFNFKYIARDFVNGSVDSVEETLQARNEKLNNAATLGQFLSSHDEDGFLATYANNDESKQKIAASLMLTAKGQPVIYYGEELGMSGKNANFDEGNYGDNRYDMPWDELEERSDMLTHYQKLLAARSLYSKVFAKGTRTKLAGGDTDQYIVFERAYNNDEVYVAINVSDEPRNVTFEVDAKAGAILTELYSGNHIVVSQDSTVTFELPSRMNGGTIILANPAVVTPTPTPPIPAPNTGEPTGNDGHLTISEEHLNGDYYDVRLSLSTSTNAITLDPVKLHKPVRLLGDGFSVVITVEQLEAWASQTGKMTVTLTAAEVKQQLDSAANAKQAQLSAQSPILELTFANEQADKALTAIKAGITLSFTAGSGDGLLTNVYQLLKNGTLQYVPAKKADGQFTVSAAEAGRYVLIRYEKVFADVTAEHWASSLIQQAAAKQFIEGKSENTFAPNDTITRAEFTAILARILGLSPDGAAPFTDVAANAWYAPAIAAAYEAGLVNGVNDHSFAPQAGITREEMAVLLVRALDYKKQGALGTASQDAVGQGTTDGTSSVVIPQHNSVLNYEDADQISSWAMEAIRKATEAGIMQGKGNHHFDPRGQSTRAEAVKVLLALEAQQ